MKLRSVVLVLTAFSLMAGCVDVTAEAVPAAAADILRAHLALGTNTDRSASLTFGDVDAEHPDRALVGPCDAVDHAQRRRLAGSVGTDEAE